MLNTRKAIIFFGVICLFFIAFLSSSSHLASAYAENPVMKASVPSVGFLHIANFLFWFVLFLIPSWGEEKPLL